MDKHRQRHIQLVEFEVCFQFSHRSSTDRGFCTVDMDYQIVKGKREDSELLYVPSEKILYVKKVERNDCQVYICYQTILSSPKKKTPGNFHPKCTARVTLDHSGTLTKNSIEHTLHENHDHIYADMKSVNNIKTAIRSLRNEYPEIVHNISVENIFYKEFAR